MHIYTCVYNVANHALGLMMYICNIAQHVPKCMSCQKAIVVITGRAHCFHDCIYITSVLLLWDLSTVCRGSLMTTYLIIVIIIRFLWLWCIIYIHRQVWEEITWYRCETSHVIFLCLALGARSIPQYIEARRTFECEQY